MRRRSSKRALPVLDNATPVHCERLRATLSHSACVGRYLLASQRSPTRFVGQSGMDGVGDAGLRYVSCRSCPEGRERAARVGNDNGRGGR